MIGTQATEAIRAELARRPRGWLGLPVQRWRRITQAGFFILFIVAPIFDIFRLDLNLGHLILFGFDWTLGLEGYAEGRISTVEATMNLLLRGFLPLVAVAGTILFAGWKWGRLYCGWLCPHFSVVETINALMRRAFGRPTLWDPHALPEDLPDGRRVAPNPLYWLAVGSAILGFAFLWAISLLTYMWPPFEVYGNLWQGELTRFQFIFLTAATIVFVIEFLLARHLFCRFGCAIGLFQSLSWMANKRAMVVGFERERVESCVDCNAACDNACPMRLKPRSTKRHMFTCTQCARCLQACDQVQKDNPQGPLLKWVQNTDALDVSARDFGRKGE